jgi:hypothetical protein
MPIRVAVAGHPLSGKSTYAESLGLPHHNTDEAIGPGITWASLSEDVSHWFDDPGPWVISGVAVPRALRKWRHRNRGLKPPIDRLVFIQRPSLGDLSPNQRSMAHGIDSVMSSLRGWLYPILTDPNELVLELARTPGDFFKYHRCWRCDSGSNPCAQRGWWRCEFPRARND